MCREADPTNYKRQHLAALQIVERYLRLRNGEDLPPRTFIFRLAKGAPGYAIGQADNSADQRHSPKSSNIGSRHDGGLAGGVPAELQCSALGQRLYPAVGPSEQISTAGKEASGTGKHEDGPERGGPRSVPRWRQCGNPRSGAAREFLPVRHTAQEIEAINRNGYHRWPWLENDPDRPPEAIDLIGSRPLQRR